MHINFVTLRIFVCLLAICTFANFANAQIDPSSLKRVDDSSAKELEESWNIKLFVDRDFNCTNLDTRNKFYIVTDDAIMNRSENKLASAIIKTLLTFSYSSGPTRCIFDSRNPSHILKFHAVVIFDDEVILDMPFDKMGAHYFETESERQRFMKRLEARFIPAVMERPEGEVEALLQSDTRTYFVTPDAFKVYHSTNTLNGLSLTVCAINELPANGDLLKGYGMSIKRVVKLNSVQELADNFWRRSCDLIPYSRELAVNLTDKLKKSEKFSSNELDLLARDELGLLKKSAAAKGSDFEYVRWPRKIVLDGGAEERQGNRIKFAQDYTRCTSGLSSFAQRTYDCNCVARKGIRRKDFSQCDTGYGFHHGKYKYFDYAKNFLDAPKGSSSEEALEFRLGVAQCVGEKFNEMFTKSVLSGKNGGSESAWYKQIINKLENACGH